MKNIAIISIVMGLCGITACDSKTEEQQTTAAPATTTTTVTGGGGAGTGGTGTGGAPQPATCSVAADCLVPEGCLACPGETQCRPYTASCIEGTCGVEQPQCPAGTGGAAQGGATTSSGGAGGK